MYDLAILGGGPAGCAAAVYASRKKLHTVLITEEFGGQSVVSNEIQNWVGTKAISGPELAKQLEEHARAYADDILDFVTGTRVTDIEKKGDCFIVTDRDGKTHGTRAILVATGADRRKLDVPGAKEFEHKGVVYCASCDGPLFTDMDVVVVGGGNAGFETAAQLLAYAKSVTLFHRGDQFKADPVTVEKVLSHENMTALTNSEPTEIIGETLVTSIKYKDTKTGEEKELPTQGVFVEIGIVPNTDFVKDVLKLDDYKRIEVDAKNQQTSVQNIWAAGDCTNELYHQNNIAAGDAVKALEDIYVNLRAK